MSDYKPKHETNDNNSEVMIALHEKSKHHLGGRCTSVQHFMVNKPVNRFYDTVSQPTDQWALALQGYNKLN